MFVVNSRWILIDLNQLNDFEVKLISFVMLGRKLLYDRAYRMLNFRRPPVEAFAISHGDEAQFFRLLHRVWNLFSAVKYDVELLNTFAPDFLPLSVLRHSSWTITITLLCFRAYPQISSQFIAFLCSSCAAFKSSFYCRISKVFSGFISPFVPVNTIRYYVASESENIPMRM